MIKLHNFIRASLLTLVLLLPAFADDHYIIRCSAINTVASQYGISVQSGLHGSDHLYVVSLPSGAVGNMMAQFLKASPLVQSLERDNAIALPEVAVKNTNNKLPSLKSYSDSSLPFVGGLKTWGPYVNQPATSLIQLDAAQKQYGWGMGIVADIDTGVDYSHPVLAGSLLPGWDFTRGYGVGDENSDLNQETTPIVDQETTPIVDGSGTIILNQETTPIVDQETTPIVDSKLPPAFGHGTMTAGLIHLVAPGAKILPLKAFASDGTGTMSAIIKAIYYAVDRGANVISMSFSSLQDSPELENAIDYAIQNKVICVASVGNGGQNINVYPAADGKAIGVGSTSNKDVRSFFSNYGNDVDLAAPGEGVISTFPRNHFAMGWGTSFSTPMVAGTVALFNAIDNNINVSKATKALQQADPAGPGVGAGRLNMLKATTYVDKH